MSTYDPQNGVEGLYCTAPVYAPKREDDRLNSMGMVRGFIYDTKDNGVIVEFVEPDYTFWFFVPMDTMIAAFNNKVFICREMKYVSMFKTQPSNMINYKTVQVIGHIRRKRMKVAVWGI